MHKNPFRLLWASYVSNVEVCVLIAAISHSNRDLWTIGTGEERRIAHAINRVRVRNRMGEKTLRHELMVSFILLVAVSSNALERADASLLL